MPERKSFLGVEIGGTKLQIAVGDPDAKILERHRFQVVPAAGAEGIRRHLEQILPGLIARWRPRAAAIGFGGPVHRDTQCVARSHQIQGWADFALGDWFSSLSGLPTLVENDANLAALGEAHHGAGVQSSPVFYVTLGSGVGGGLILHGGIYHGASPGEAELGHVLLDRQGATLESRCSGWAVDARVREASIAAPNGVLAQLTRESHGGEAQHLKTALEASDPAAKRILDETSNDLAFGLSHMVHLMHPETIILGGGLSLVGEALRARVAAALSLHLMETFQPGPQVRLAALGEDAVPIGCLVAAALHWDQNAI